MSARTSPQPLAVGEVSVSNDKIKQSYASTVQAKQPAPTSFELCPVIYDQDEPIIQFTMEEVNNFTKEEGLHQAIIIKFSYGRPDLAEVRKLFSSQFDVQGHCNVGHLEFWHLLIRFDLYDDYIRFLSKSTGYLKSKREAYFFRTFPWTFGFNPREETSIAVVWISLPGLPPNFFAKRSLMSIASAVGKPLAVDKATQDRTRPSAARVKVIVNLLNKHPNKVMLQILDSASGKTVEFHQQIVFDNLPKYCTYCKHQGHEVKDCRIRKENAEADVVIEDNVVADLIRNDGNEVDKLQGDARDFLNGKRAGQRAKDLQEKADNSGVELSKVAQSKIAQHLTLSAEAVASQNRDKSDHFDSTVQMATKQNDEPQISVIERNDADQLVSVKTAVVTEMAEASHMASPVESIKELQNLVNLKHTTQAASDFDLNRKKHSAANYINYTAQDEHLVERDGQPLSSNVQQQNLVTATTAENLPITKGDSHFDVTVQNTVPLQLHCIVDNENIGSKSGNAGTIQSSVNHSSRSAKNGQMIDLEGQQHRSNKQHQRNVNAVNGEMDSNLKASVSSIKPVIFDAKIVKQKFNEQQQTKQISNIANDSMIDQSTGNNTDHMVLTVQPKQKSTVSTTKDNSHKTGQQLERAVTQLTATFHDLRYTVEQQPDSPKHSNVNSFTHKTAAVPNETVSSRGLEYAKIHNAPTVKIRDMVIKSKHWKDKREYEDEEPWREGLFDEESAGEDCESHDKSTNAIAAVPNSIEDHRLTGQQLGDVSKWKDHRHFCANLKREQENTLKQLFLFENQRFERVIKDKSQNPYLENSLKGKSKIKWEAPDFIPSKPIVSTCVHFLDTPPNIENGHIGTSKSGAILMKNATWPEKKPNGRQIPMRAAKQKQATSISSSKSNRSKYKR